MKTPIVKNLTFVIILTLVAAFGGIGCDEADQEQPVDAPTIEESPVQIVPTLEPEPPPVVEVPTPPECVTNADCSDGRICTEGKCVAAKTPPPAVKPAAEGSFGDQSSLSEADVGDQTIIKASQGEMITANPMWWGATGDGISDDAQAFQNAADTQLPIIIPQPLKNYYINSTVTLKSKFVGFGNSYYGASNRIEINLGPNGKLVFDVGSGFENIYVRSSNANVLITIKDRFIEGRNFFLQGTGKGGGQTAIHFEASSGQGTNATSHNTLSHFWISNIGTAFLFTGTGKYGYATNNRFLNGYITDTTNAFKITNSPNGAFASNWIKNLYIEDTDYGFYCESFPASTSIDVYFDDVISVFHSTVPVWATNNIHIERGGKTIAKLLSASDGVSIVDGFTIEDSTSRFVWMNEVMITSLRNLRGSQFYYNTGHMEVGLNDNYGPLMEFAPVKSNILSLLAIRFYIKDMDKSKSEDITFKIIAYRHDGTLATFEKKYSSNGTFYLGSEDMFDLFLITDGSYKVITGFGVQAKTNLATTSAKMSCTWVGHLY